MKNEIRTLIDKLKTKEDIYKQKAIEYHKEHRDIPAIVANERYVTYLEVRQKLQSILKTEKA